MELQKYDNSDLRKELKGVFAAKGLRLININGAHRANYLVSLCNSALEGVLNRYIPFAADYKLTKVQMVIICLKHENLFVK